MNCVIYGSTDIINRLNLSFIRFIFAAIERMLSIIQRAMVESRQESASVPVVNDLKIKQVDNHLGILLVQIELQVVHRGERSIKRSYVRV